MTTNGHSKYELTQDLELWSNHDLISYVLDTEGVMGLEKFEIARFAQELANRFDAVCDQLDEYPEDDDEREHEYND